MNGHGHGHDHSILKGELPDAVKSKALKKPLGLHVLPTVFGAPVVLVQVSEVVSMLTSWCLEPGWREKNDREACTISPELALIFPKAFQAFLGERLLGITRIEGARECFLIPSFTFEE